MEAIKAINLFQRLWKQSYELIDDNSVYWHISIAVYNSWVAPSSSVLEKELAARLVIVVRDTLEFDILQSHSVAMTQTQFHEYKYKTLTEIWKPKHNPIIQAAIPALFTIAKS